ncbi:hypothetical protein [Candidatus Methylobacter favarea]|uniref:hypothetical protein n=1 Tax=Candidatus Methylobacter favarea TaxID=2707345 RepID=UPI001C2DA80D|nr:hypothetical protein [Candidatus Methylobacter favarea]
MPIIIRFTVNSHTDRPAQTALSVPSLTPRLSALAGIEAVQKSKCVEDRQYYTLMADFEANTERRYCS